MVIYAGYGYARPNQDYFATVKGDHSYQEQAKDFEKFRIFLEESMLNQDEVRLFAHFIYCRLHHYNKSGWDTFEESKARLYQ